MVKGIKEVYAVKNLNAKGSSCETHIKSRNLNEEKAAKTNNFIQIVVPIAGYIIVDNQRVYLNYLNAIDFGEQAIIDVDEVMAAKKYAFNEKYSKDDDVVFANEAEMRALAQDQYDVRGELPQMTRISNWDADKGVHYIEYTFNVPAEVEDDDQSEEADNEDLQENAEQVFENTKDALIDEMAEALEGDNISKDEIIRELISKSDTKLNISLAIENGGLTFKGMSESEMVELLTTEDLQHYLHVNNLNDIPADWDDEVNEIVEALDGFVNEYGVVA